MTRSPFAPPFEKLPASLPIFPLAGGVVMPGAPLPLNIFEPRYLNMVGDALGGDRLIGMVQPDVKAAGRHGEAVCRTGTAGRITAFSETDDGRFLMRLTGLCRFDILEEVPTTRGYRRVAASWDRFAGDYDDDARIADRHGLLARLRRYSTARGLEIDWQGLAGMPDALLTNLLVTSLPLEPPDKQALVETVALNDRARLMSQLLDLAPTAPAQSPSRPH
jgi:hypothetical protein